MKCNQCGDEILSPTKEGVPVCNRCLLGAGLNLKDTASEKTEPSGARPPVSVAAPDADPVRERLQELFPEFELLDKLGAGGMGSVYQARQKSLDRLVAIKILSSKLEGDPEFEERFEREAKAMAMLNHPNIVSIYDFGVRESFHFFVMEYVEGRDLSRLIKSGNVAEELAFSIIAQVCDALHFAHQQGVIHRDVKPGNIFVDRNGIAKMGDFGLAQIANQSQDFSLTMTGVGMGTPSYMAPEQLTDAKAIDARADIYALGVVIYELLTGKVPAGNFPPPTSGLPRRNKRLDRAVLRAMEPNLDERASSVQEISSAVAKSDPVARASQTPSTGKWQKPALFLVPLVCLGLVGFLWNQRGDGTSPVVNSLRPAGDPQPRLLIPPVLPMATDTYAAQRERGGRLRAWSQMSDIIDLDAAGEIDDFLTVSAGRYVAVSWYAIRKDGQLVSNLPTLDKRYDLRKVAHSFLIEWPDTLVPVEKNSPAYLPLMQETNQAIDLAQVYDVAFLVTPQREIRLAAADQWRKSHRAVIDRVGGLSGVTMVKSFGKVIATLSEEGDLVSWIEPHGFIEAPESSKRIVQVETGGNHLLLLYEDGSIQTACNPTSLNHSRIGPVMEIPDEAGPFIRIKAFDFTNAVQREDGSWFAWGDDLGTGLIEQINSVGPALDFEFFSINQSKGAKLIWIEPAGLPTASENH